MDHSTEAERTEESCVCGEEDDGFKISKERRDNTATRNKKKCKLATLK